MSYLSCQGKVFVFSVLWEDDFEHVIYAFKSSLCLLWAKEIVEKES